MILIALAIVAAAGTLACWHLRRADRTCIVSDCKKRFDNPQDRARHERTAHQLN